MKNEISSNYLLVSWELEKAYIKSLPHAPLIITIQQVVAIIIVLEEEEKEIK